MVPSIKDFAEQSVPKDLTLPTRVLGTQKLAVHLLTYLGICDAEALGSTFRSASIACKVAAVNRPRRLYVCGGSAGRGAFATAEKLLLAGPQVDLAKEVEGAPLGGRWELLPCAALAPGRSLAAAGVIDGRVYVAGGWDGHNFVSAAAVLDFQANPFLWRRVRPMAESRGGAAGTAIAGHFYVCGGRQDDDPINRKAVYLSSGECFEPRRATWERLPDMAEARGSAAAARLGGRLYVVGGVNKQRGTLNTAVRFDASHGCWEELPPLARARSAAACASLQGRLFVCGGMCGRSVIGSVECFDETSHAWSEAPAMLERRSMACATTAAGRLFVFGGFDGANYLGSVECFARARQQWFPAVALSERRAGAVAAMLSV